MQNNAPLIIFFMALVTYIPRFLPAAVLKKINVPPMVRDFLSFVPYASLGALIIPGVFSSTDSYITSAAGLAAAVVLSLIGINLIAVVFLSAAAVYLVQFLV